MDKQYVLDNTILLVRHGSYAYGLNTPASDIDIKGVVCVGPKYHLGLSRFDQSEDFEDDQVRYDLRKFVQLAGKCNPNIIEVLFVDDSDILEITPVGEKLRAAREMFVSREAQKTFVGYAISQLKRIRAKYRWITNPPSAKPQQKDFYREPQNEIEMGLLKKGTKIYDQDAYRLAMKDWGNYQRWLTDRNPARKELEQKYGFDTKHAMHLVRLLRMGCEIMATGKVLVRRPDREELLAIRNGAWKYDDLVSWAEAKKKEIDRLVEDSPLPVRSNFNKLEQLVMELTIEHWTARGWIQGSIVL